MSFYKDCNLLFFEIGSCVILGLTWTMILLFMLPHLTGMTGTHHLVQALSEMRSC
jgi:hypothetical protein